MTLKSSSDVMSYIENRQSDFLEELKDYLRIPSISTDPEYKKDVSRCADFVVDNMSKAGIESRAY